MPDHEDQDRPPGSRLGEGRAGIGVEKPATVARMTGSPSRSRVCAKLSLSPGASESRFLHRA